MIRIGVTRMKKSWIDRLYTVGFVVVLGTMLAWFIASPKQAFSKTENRVLQKAPKLTWDRVVSNQFAEDAELFVSDHFPFRTQWVMAKSLSEQLRLQKENNGIYKGKDGWLFEKYEKPDEAELAAYVDAVNRFAANHPQARVGFMLAPNSVGLYPERLPWLAEAYPQTDVNDWVAEHLSEAVSFLNGFDFLEPAARGDRPVYYRTDHHWTTYGAYLAYAAYAEHMGWEPLPEDRFHIREVSASFLGSYHTRSQFAGIEPDAMEIYEPKQAYPVVVTVADTGDRKTSLYDESYLDKKDKYSYFQGGVHALVQIDSELPSAPSSSSRLDKLLVIKDSYAHSMVPFLTQHASQIHMIDIRFYNGNIGDYMEASGIEDVLLLFNTSTFSGERNVLKLKY